MDQYKVTCEYVVYEEEKACPYPELVDEIVKDYSEIKLCVFFCENKDCIYCRTMRYQEGDYE
jgi:hypothetical protein